MAVSSRIAPPLLLVVLLAACAPTPSESYGFIATLGNDTTSIERITRTGSRIVSEQVGRSPLVVHRRWEATLAPDGTVRRWTLDTHIPNAPPGATDLHHEAEFDAGAIRLVRHTAADSSDATYAPTLALTVPWNAFVYGTYELLFQAAAGRPDTTRIGQYFFEGWAEGTIGHARLRRLDNGAIAISSTGLAGSGVARLDEQGRMLSYSGEGTTYRQEVTRITDVPDIAAIVARFAAAEKAAGAPRSLSVRDTMQADVGGARVTVEYSRPLARGRTLVGGLIPHDQVWRTGANAATHLTVSAPVQLAGIALDSGSYTLWTLPSRQDVQLIVNAQTGQWGTGYQQSRDIARAPMQVETTAAPVEQFTIRVDSATAGAARLVMEWGTFRWSAPIRPASDPAPAQRRN
jgi:hypothetical protein